MKKIIASLVVGLVAVAAFVASAVTITNQGQIITITKLSETADAGTVTEDQSTYATPAARMGLIVAHCVVPSTYTNGMAFGPTIPMGAILSEASYAEVSTGLLGGTNVAITVGPGGLDVLASATNNVLNSAGIKALVATSVITTNAAQLYLSNSGLSHTQGTFTVYIPYILGNAGR